MSDVKRKAGETFESLLRRFSKKLQESGRILQAKKIRFYQKESNKNKKRKDALRRNEIKNDREYLKKIGKLPEEDYKTSRRR
ncbi:MAG: 30S ribosomal protein S21 [bacterium]